MRSSGRIVRASRPRAKLAAGLLPAWRRALASTARRTGTPFQCRTSTSGTNVGCASEAATLVTRNLSGSGPPSVDWVDAPLDEEGQEGGAGRERGGQQVVGVQVAHRGEDLGQLAVELDLGAAGLLRQRGEPVAQQAQPLHRVDRVHRPLEHEVDVALLDHHERLVDEEQAVGEREGAVAHAAEEVAEQPGLGGPRRRLDERDRRRLGRGGGLGSRRADRRTDRRNPRAPAGAPPGPCAGTGGPAPSPRRPPRG